MFQLSTFVNERRDWFLYIERTKKQTHRWSLIAAQLPGRTDNDVKNYWNTKLKKKLSGMGIDPVTHKPFSHLMAEIATTLAPPQVAHLAEAALGCFKDEMLHLLTKKCVDFTAAGPSVTSGEAMSGYATMDSDKEETIKKIKLGLSRAMHEPIIDPNNTSPPTKPWILLGSDGEPSDGLMSLCNNYTTGGGMDRFGFGGSSYLNNGEGSSWNQNLCGGGTHIDVVATGSTLDGQLVEKREDDDGEEAQGEKLLRKDSEGLFESECGLWDLTDDLMIQ